MAKKLKSDKSITGLLPAITALSIVAVAGIFFGLAIGFRVMAVVILVYSLFQFYAFSKVRNLSYFVSATYILTFSLFLFLVPVSERGFVLREFPPLSKFLGFVVILLLLWLLYLLATRKTKWKGREVFELAAMPVEEASDGFTARPRPTGKTGYSKEDVLAFAGFLRKNQIALPFEEEDKVVLVLVMMGREFSLLYTFRPNYMERSWVAFTFNGDIAVHISKKDYLEYKDQLSFDRLCESMGELFKEFLELFCKGDGVRIIDRLDSTGIGVLS